MANPKFFLSDRPAATLFNAAEKAPDWSTALQLLWDHVAKNYLTSHLTWALCFIAALLLLCGAVVHLVKTIRPPRTRTSRNGAAFAAAAGGGGGGMRLMG